MNKGNKLIYQTQDWNLPIIKSVEIKTNINTNRILIKGSNLYFNESRKMKIFNYDMIIENSPDGNMISAEIPPIVNINWEYLDLTKPAVSYQSLFGVDNWITDIKITKITKVQSEYTFESDLEYHDLIRTSIWRCVLLQFLINQQTDEESKIIYQTELNILLQLLDNVFSSVNIGYFLQFPKQSIDSTIETFFGKYFFYSPVSFDQVLDSVIDIIPTHITELHKPLIPVYNWLINKSKQLTNYDNNTDITPMPFTTYYVNIKFSDNFKQYFKHKKSTIIGNELLLTLIPWYVIFIADIQSPSIYKVDDVKISNKIKDKLDEYQTPIEYFSSKFLNSEYFPIKDMLSGNLRSSPIFTSFNKISPKITSRRMLYLDFLRDVDISDHILLDKACYKFIQTNKNLHTINSTEKQPIILHASLYEIRTYIPKIYYIGVIGPRRSGKSSLLKSISESDIIVGPEQIHSTRFIKLINVNSNIVFIDFPGMDESDNNISSLTRYFYLILNQCIVVLNSTNSLYANTININNLIKNIITPLIKYKVPIIIDFSKIDSLLQNSKINPRSKNGGKQLKKYIFDNIYNPFASKLSRSIIRDSAINLKAPRILKSLHKKYPLLFYTFDFKIGLGKFDIYETSFFDMFVATVNSLEILKLEYSENKYPKYYRSVFEVAKKIISRAPLSLNNQLSEQTIGNILLKHFRYLYQENYPQNIKRLKYLKIFYDYDFDLKSIIPTSAIPVPGEQEYYGGIYQICNGMFNKSLSTFKISNETHKYNLSLVALLMIYKFKSLDSDYTDLMTKSINRKFTMLDVWNLIVDPKSYISNEHPVFDLSIFTNDLTIRSDPFKLFLYAALLNITAEDKRYSSPEVTDRIHGDKYRESDIYFMLLETNNCFLKRQMFDDIRSQYISEPKQINLIKTVKYTLKSPNNLQSSKMISKMVTQNNQLLSFGYSDNSIILWKVSYNTNELTQTNLFNIHTSVVVDVIFCEETSKYLFVSASSDGTVIFWLKNGTHEIKKTIKHLEDNTTLLSISICHDENIIATGFSDNFIKVFQLLYPHEIKYELLGHTDSVSSLSFSPNNRYLASGSLSKDSSIKIWDLTYKTTQFIFSNHTGSIIDLSWSPNSKLLASSSDDSSITIYSMVNYRVQSNIKLRTNGFKSLSFSPDSKYLISVSLNRELKIFLASRPHFFNMLVPSSNNRYTDIQFFTVSSHKKNSFTIFTSGTDFIELTTFDESTNIGGFDQLSIVSIPTEIISLKVIEHNPSLELDFSNQTSSIIAIQRVTHFELNKLLKNTTYKTVYPVLKLHNRYPAIIYDSDKWLNNVKVSKEFTDKFFDKVPQNISFIIDSRLKNQLSVSRLLYNNNIINGLTILSIDLPIVEYQRIPTTLIRLVEWIITVSGGQAWLLLGNMKCSSQNFQTTIDGIINSTNKNSTDFTQIRQQYQIYDDGNPKSKSYLWAFGSKYTFLNSYNFSTITNDSSLSPFELLFNPIMN